MPGTSSPSRSWVARVGFGPTSAVVGKFIPSWTASSVPFLGPRPIIRLIHPLRASEPGAASSTSSMAEKCERLAHAEAGGLDRRQLAGLPQRLQRSHRGVQPEHRVLAQQGACSDRGRGPRPVVGRIAVGYDDAEPVDASAQADHHHRVAAGRAREAGLHHRLAEHLRDGHAATDGRGPLQQRAAREAGPGEVAAAVRLRRVGVLGHRLPHVVMWSGVSSRALTSRGNSQPASECSRSTVVEAVMIAHLSGPVTAWVAASSRRASAGRPSQVRHRWSTYVVEPQRGGGQPRSRRAVLRRLPGPPAAGQVLVHPVAVEHARGGRPGCARQRRTVRPRPGEQSVAAVDVVRGVGPRAPRDGASTSTSSTRAVATRSATGVRTLSPEEVRNSGWVDSAVSTARMSVPELV